MEKHRISERKACRLVNLNRSTYRYKKKRKEDIKLKETIRNLAYKWQSYGYRRLQVLLKKEGIKINHKKFYRLYKELNLQLRRKKKKTSYQRATNKIKQVVKPNQRWSMDFLSDSISTGRRIRILSIIDEYSRECLALEADTSLSGERVCRVLETICKEKGYPETIITDNGPEFRSKQFAKWLNHNKINWHPIEPGKPYQNGYIESFNGKFREECLNRHWFKNLKEARELIEEWRKTYNEIRPHSSLNYMSPKEFLLAHCEDFSATPSSPHNGCGRMDMHP